MFLLALTCLTSFVACNAGVAFHNPADGGGSMLNNAGDGFGEPLNVIISGLSSPAVLTDNGILNYARAIGFSNECLGIHLGNPQSANLGDGHGWVNQTASAAQALPSIANGLVELREDYGNPLTGTCLESLIGGNHFRVYRQNGPAANSGALFLAVSWEQSESQSHTISPDGYDVGRNALVATANGRTSFGGVTYQTVTQNLTGLLAPGSQGINHGIAQDGTTALLTVQII